MKKMKLKVGLFLGLVASMTSLKASEDITYDYIIVGNGTAGGVLARKLSDDKKTKVLVLESGVNHTTDPKILDVSGQGLFQNFTDITLEQQYAETYVVPGFFPLQYFVYSEGRGWGGSSLHNYLEVFRGTPSFYDGMAAIAGDAQWSYNSLLPLMIALENYTPCQSVANPAQRGVGGPISMTQSAPITTDPLGLLLAGVDAGNAGFNTDLNDPTQVTTTGFYNIGFSPFQYFATTGGAPCTLGERSFSANTFINPSIVDEKGNGKHGRLLRIESNSYVSRVLFKDKKAVGVEFVYGPKGNKILTAKGKKIILCAGGVNSSAILQRSGIGDPSILEPLGIDVLVNNPNVGANMINQIGADSIFTGTTNATPFLQGMLNGSGVVTPGFSYPADNTRRLQVLALQLQPGVVQSIGFNVQPKSRGTIQIVSRSPLIQPNIDFKMYSDGPVTTVGTDANLAVAYYYLIEQAVTGGGGVMNYPSASQYAGGADALLRAAESSGGITITSHICGTTRMATSIADGVVDSNLNVFGVKNLMVVDLGVAPISPDGNTCYAVYTIALNAARILGVKTPPAL